jgi:hypothetical protein
MTTTYTTEGSVRGNCGHAHQSVGAAERCRAKDQRSCAGQGGYSDRSVVRADGEPLSDWEIEELNEEIDRI